MAAAAEPTARAAQPAAARRAPQARRLARAALLFAAAGPASVMAATNDSNCALNASAWLPANATLGSCRETLDSGSSCQLGCVTGYQASDGWTGNVSCEEGGLAVEDGQCEPASCDTFAALPVGGDLGQCPQVLLSGQACQPDCAINATLIGNLSCHLGVVSPAQCLPPLQCEAGKEQSGSTCQPCPAATYKPDVGPGPCLRCPLGREQSPQGGSSFSVCICNSGTYAAARTSSPCSSCENAGCAPCPNNSHIAPNQEPILRNCKCTEEYLRVPAEEAYPLQACRLSQPCNVRLWLQQRNLTGPEDYKLQLGSCADFVGSPSGMLPSGLECRLTCKPGAAPQLQADFFKAVETSLMCMDGEITGPPAMTWCSETSFEIPPLVFLATVTLASLVAGCRMEVRQHSFEQRCVQALRLRLPATSQGARGSIAGAKCKVA